ncbi:MAG: hypothetical protein KBD66_02030, partial [Candidatus Doudnabacteria bacterium]|nr:hypothetical protein [Candidatus Doudnabacteria bacterium]
MAKDFLYTYCFPWYNAIMEYFLSIVTSAITSIRAVFRDNPLFGIIFLGLLGTALLFSPFGGTYFEAIKYPWAVSVLGAYIVYFSVYGKSVSWSWYGGVCVFLVIWAGLTALLSPSHIVSLIGHFPRYNSSVLLFAFFVVTIWAGLTVTRAGRAKVLVNGLLAVGGFAAIFAILQSFGFASYTGIESFFSSTPDRVSSLLGNPNFSALFLSGMVPFAVGFVLVTRSRMVRWFGIVNMFMLVWAIALFASRGAILATAIGMVPMVVWFIWRRRWVQGFVLVLAIVLSVWLFSGPFLLYRGQEATVLVT